MWARLAPMTDRRQHGAEVTAQDVHQPGEHAGQVASHVAGVRKEVGEAGPDLDRLDEERHFGREPAIDGGLGDTGAGCDALDAHPGKSLLGEHGERGCEDRLVQGRVAVAAGSLPLAGLNVDLRGIGHDEIPTATGAGTGGVVAGCSLSRARAGRNSTTPIAARSVTPAAASPMMCRPLTKLSRAALAI
jgi:hypothetical protein